MTSLKYHDIIFYVSHEHALCLSVVVSSNMKAIDSGHSSTIARAEEFKAHGQNYQHHWVILVPIADRGRVGRWNDLHTAIKSRSCFVPPPSRRCSGAVFEMSRPPDNTVSTLKTQRNRRRPYFAVTWCLVCACVVGFCRQARLHVEKFVFKVTSKSLNSVGLTCVPQFCTTLNMK